MTKSEIDFSAWEAPSPPEGVADAVVARMAEPEPRPEPVPPKRRWVIAASAAAVLAIAGGVWAITRPRGEAAPDHGEVVADKPRHLELGGVSADLDRGADVRWQRTRTALEIEQRAGAASWRVGKEQHVRIGATVAAIDATGASLRVEVPVNTSDARVIGASAATAAAVAMLSVVVYEGHVKVASSGQTVVVQPGETYAVPAPQRVATIDAKPTLAVLALENGDRVGAQLTELLRQRAAALGSYRYVITDKQLRDLEILHDCGSEAPLCMNEIAKDLGVDTFVYGRLASRQDGYQYDVARFADGRIVADSYSVIARNEALSPVADSIMSTLFDLRPDAPDETVVQQILAAAAPRLRTCLIGAVTDETITVDINSDGKPMNVRTQARGGGEDSMCIARVAQTLAFPKSKHGGTFTSHVMLACDADALTNEGMEAEQAGQYASALASFEAAVQCQPSARLHELAFMAACNAKSFAKAREYWGTLSASSAKRLVQMCVRNGISEQALALGMTAVPVGTGTVRIDSVPPARVLLDGKEFGHTPLVLNAPPGTYKVTYVVGDDRYTWPVTVKAGETETLSKTLR